MLKKTFFLIILLSCITTSFSQTPRTDVTGPYLLKTAWGGSAPLNMFAPKSSSPGCHAIAFAQVMFFHQLKPHGAVSYKCSDGTLISEDFSDYAPEWNRFALNKESGRKDIAATKRTARFIYYVASIVRKDFGTNQYVDYPDDFHKQAIESHFDCTLTASSMRIHSSIGEALNGQPDVYTLLKKEIDSHRPAGFYYTDQKGGGHAVVIDGYTVKNGKTYFHVNFGWLGNSDGWYLLEKDLPPKTKEIAMITIVPKSSGKGE